MAKLATAAALLATLLFIAHASAFRTTITTVITDNDRHDRRESECREQIMRQDLSPCMRYVKEQMNEHRSRNLEQCCEQMRDMEENCRCVGLQREMMQQSQQLSGQEMRRMREKAERLPSKCNMGPQSCDFGRISL
ncbi:hypothetical protein UlMin_003493 [Ulmus minor]